MNIVALCGGYSFTQYIYICIDIFHVYVVIFSNIFRIEDGIGWAMKATMYNITVTSCVFIRHDSLDIIYNFHFVLSRRNCIYLNSE